MKAAVLDRDGIGYREVQEPAVVPNHVKVKVAFCGICGSDLPRVFNGKAHHYPIILGHEFSGVIVELGDGVDDLSVGDRVVGVPLIPCFSCDNCKKGVFSLCEDYSFIGSRIDGGYGEYVCIPRNNVLKISDSVSLRDAATIEPCTVSRHAFELADVKDKTVAVIGSGIIGLFAVQWARIKGARSVILVTHGNKGIMAENVGSDAVVIDDQIGSVKSDVVLDCAGTNESLVQSLRASNPKGSIVLIGTPKQDITFTVKEWEMINRKELSVIGSWMSYSGVFPGIEWVESVKFFGNGNIKIVEDMIDDVVDVEQVSSTFGMMKDRKSRGRILLALDRNLE